MVYVVNGPDTSWHSFDVIDKKSGKGGEGGKAPFFSVLLQRTDRKSGRGWRVGGWTSEEAISVHSPSGPCAALRPRCSGK